MSYEREKLGNLIKPVDERNDLGIREFFGLNISKEFMPTAASTDSLDESKYKVVRRNRFVFSGMQTGRDKTIRISMYEENQPVLVSPAYTTFEVSAIDRLLPDYLYMRFLSSEMDRYGWFLSDGSVRANLDWPIFCDIEICLPPLEVQKRYVDIFQGLRRIYRSSEASLKDLQLAYELQLDRAKHSSAWKSVGSILRNVDVRNSDLAVRSIKGINVSKTLMDTKASVSAAQTSNYKVVRTNQFAYSAMQTGRDECIRIALHAEDEPVVVSPAYSVLEAIDPLAVTPQYVMMWFARAESDRYGWFASDASIRASLELERFFEIQIPVPSTEVQLAVVALYNAYIERQEIVTNAKNLMNKMCPVLIKGSLDEARREEVSA